MPSTITLDKDKILAQLASLSSIVQENKWEFDYDPTIDTLTYSQKIIPGDAYLVSVDDDISFYIDQELKLRGLMIEYFTGNYVEHNKELEPVVSIIIAVNTKKGDKDKRKIASGLFEADIMRESIPSLMKVKELKTIV